MGLALAGAERGGGPHWTFALAPLQDPPYPSLSDVFYLAGYAPLGVSVLVLTRTRVPRLRTSTWLDGMVAGLGAAGLLIAIGLRSLVGLSGGDLSVVVVNLAYPLADVALVVVLVASAAVTGLRLDRAVVALSVGLVLYLGADLSYLVRAAGGTYVAGGWSDLGWLLAVATLGLGAWTRTRPVAALADELDETRLGWRVLAVPTAAHCSSLVLLVVGWGDTLPLAAGVCAGACLAMALVRTGVTFHEIRDLPTVRRQARTDELTGLANRRALLERCDRLLDGERRPPGPVSLLLLDLDGFKEVNDSLGHQAGDELLLQVARRLEPLVAPDQVLARLGGDEFAVLLPGSGPDEAVALARSLARALDETFVVDGVRLHVGGSVGVASAPEPATTRQELLRCADVAMYEAKRSRAGVVAFDGVQGAATGDRLRTTQELHEAFARGELTVHLQPQVSLLASGARAAGSVVGVEALVRWEHPSRGLLAPAAFLDHVERAGLQRRLAEQVLDLALAAAARWWGRGHAVPVSVNLTAADVVDLDLPGAVGAALERHGLPATALTVELTEEALMQDTERGSSVLGALRDLGVGVSIDDYGTGYASLAYLRSLPADGLKLDRAFTAGVLDDERSEAIVRHTAALAHDLGLHLVAEGIETAEVLVRLAELGCDRGQGYHVARPMPLGDLMAWLETVTEAGAGPVVTPAAAPGWWGSPARPWTAPGPPRAG